MPSGTYNTRMLSTIGQIAINVHDSDRATAFYRDQLGMKHLFSAGKLSFFDCDGVRLMLSPPENAEFDHPSSILYFKVADINQQYETMQSRGVKFEDKPHLVAPMPTYDLWMTFFRDSENNMLALMSEVKR
ncbi:MAG: methylmalonyl-CoA epimerase [Acidobacteriales bacterium]|nr:methylmalonyl-CoA epimerase [Terriglobales bacterium]